MTAEDVLDERDPVKALDAFRALDTDEKLTAVFADGSIMRYESRLIEGIVFEFRTWGRRILRLLLVLTTLILCALTALIVLALGNRQLGRETARLSEQIVECTTPNTPCTDRARGDDSQLTCIVLALQNDNRLVNAYDPDQDGAVNTLPVPKECQP